MEATRQPRLQEMMRFTKVKLTVWFNSLTTFYNKCFPQESILFLEVSCSSLDLSELMQGGDLKWDTSHQTLFYFWKNNDVLQTHSVCGPARGGTTSHCDIHVFPLGHSWAKHGSRSQPSLQTI